ncbi:unnamed protein product [Caenorhabditis brenneri]
MPRGQRRLELVKRVRQAASSGDKEGGVSEFVGCPVLDPIQCQCPKEEVDPSEGVKMTCTWESCPYSNQPLHAICYQMLEDNLVRRLATLGSARGWTVPQRRNNLWERKGQSLIGKFCRCRCDRGQMTRDKQALYEKEKAVEKEKKKKAKKAKQLPQLQFNSKPSAAIEEKKRDIVYSPSAISSHHNQTFSTTTRSRLHTDRSMSSMRTYTVGRTWSESSFAGEAAGRYDNNENIHPSDCDCVFHYDYDADDDREVDHLELYNEVDSLEMMIPAPLPPPQEKSYAATIMDMQNRQNKDSTSPDSGIAPTPRLSISYSSNEEEISHRHGDFFNSSKRSLNPLGLSILSPLEVSSQDENEPPRFSELTSTPRLPRKKESIRAKSSISSSKLPLALPSQLLSDETHCAFSFSAPVREMMDVWNEVTASESSSKCLNSNNHDDSIDSAEVGWTPLFGRGFNLGERLYYLP